MLFLLPMFCGLGCKRMVPVSDHSAKGGNRTRKPQTAAPKRHSKTAAVEDEADDDGASFNKKKKEDGDGDGDGDDSDGPAAYKSRRPRLAKVTFPDRRDKVRTGGALLPAPGEKRTPQVWHRDRRRPAFARVYLGGGNSLELVSLQVTVTVEGPRARTLVDHIFHNPHDRRLEGTFEYPLPTGASPSYYAMFIGRSQGAVPRRFRRRGGTPALPPATRARLSPAQVVGRVSSTDWGNLQQGRIVAREKALETYEQIVRGRIDPALLQYAGGNTFRGRVFPIPAGGYNRVLIAYEELLPVSGGKVTYRFPLPDCRLTDLQVTLQADSTEAAGAVFRPRGARKEVGGGKVSYTRSWQQQGPGGEVLFHFPPPRSPVQVISGRQGENGPQYLYARVRLPLREARARPFARHAVFLLDTSLSEQPDRFAVNMKLLRAILEADPDIEHFNILTFDVGARWVEPGGWLPNTRAGREKAWKRLNGIVLEGATDLSAALDRLVKPGFPIARGTPLNVFLLSDGQITWGESAVAPLVARFEKRCPYPTRFHCYRTGIGAENQELFAALARRGGGVFTCYGEAELEAVAQAHHHHCFQLRRVSFTGDVKVTEVLVAGRQAAVYPGGDLVVTGQAARTGKVQLVLEGTFLGKKAVFRLPLEVAGGSELAARGWGEVAVASLLALHEPKLDRVVTAYCQQFGIASRVASFLVLENDADYKRWDLQTERGRTLPGDVGRFVEEAWKKQGKTLRPRRAWERFLAGLGQRVGKHKGDREDHVRALLDLMTDADFALPRADLGGRILRRADVPAAYLQGRARDRRDVGLYIAEARRRRRRQDVAGAVRALSSVVEEFPGRADALRLVGYRLLDLRQPAHAVRLFRQVQRQRPFEAHSYRDLARSLEASRKYALAALQYEIILAGQWHNRFGPALRQVARDEYVHLLAEAVKDKSVRRPLARHFAGRFQDLASGLTPSDLRVTISWNTDATDVDLWVVEPDGTRCYYMNKRTQRGGTLSQDQTQGYGPERYQIGDAGRGTYQIIVHYFAPNPNLLGGETHVNVVVTRFAGGPREVSERHTVILKHKDEQVVVCKVKF
jgi:hypothetical protein